MNELLLVLIHLRQGLWAGPVLPIRGVAIYIQQSVDHMGKFPLPQAEGVAHLDDEGCYSSNTSNHI